MRHVTLVGALVLISACADPTANERVLTGSVSGIYATPPSAAHPGEIRVAGTAVGEVRVYITIGMPITIRTASGAVEIGDFTSFALGDAVVLWYQADGPILESLPPVYPVRRIRIER